MYLNQFGFQEKPFHITPNPRFIFLSKNHKDAFAHLLYGLQQRVGFLSLTGEVGTGKTTVLRTLLGQLEDGEYSLALILNPCLSALELMETIHREFSIPCREGQNIGQLHESLNRFLLEQREKGITVVLVVDEAQNLEPAVLEQLRLLSNLETETDKLIQMVLVGQPELEALFERRDLRQLRQRLMVRYRLLPMDEEDTEAYIRHRLKVAGWKGGSLFDRGALRSIYRLTGGTPRLINILCDRALLVAYSQDLDSVASREVRSAQSELLQVDQAVQTTGGRQVPILLAVMFAVIVSLVLLWPKLSDDLERFSQASLTGQPVPAPVSQPAAAAPAAPMAEGGATESVEAPLPPPTDQANPQRIEELQARVAALAPGATLQQALAPLLALWSRDREPLNLQLPPADMLADAGLLASSFHGELELLLSFNRPALLELAPPMTTSRHYFALLGVSEDQVLLVPGLTESGWLDKAELEQIWFGRAVIPWLNTDQIPYLMEPGLRLDGIARLQALLSRLGFDELAQTGVFDPQTIRAVTALQRNNGLTPDGRVGAQTLLLLYRLAGYEYPHLVGGGAL
ncbi:MAG: AAA family ATPase [Desulfuromonadales bacterium]|nr:AAA family ATPase [Desulfuromonadales bacterium]